MFSFWNRPWTRAALVVLFPAGRPRSEDPLESAKRKELLDIVEAEPGISVVDLAAKSSLPWGSVYYHLNRLLGSAIIRIEEDPFDARRRRVFLADEEDLSALGDARLRGAGRDIAALVAASPGLDLRQVVERTGRPVRTVQAHLRSLVEDGFITSASTTRYRGLQPTPALLELLGDAKTAKKVGKKQPKRTR